MIQKSSYIYKLNQTTSNQQKKWPSTPDNENCIYHCQNFFCLYLLLFRIKHHDFIFIQLTLNNKNFI
ncbi:hypothetical protein LR61_17640 [Morganella morganii]|nr:hypothetical protein LR61_17640 [Morganella morganii]